jgi:uncharacterized protein YdaU (DUF1376 family)
VSTTKADESLPWFVFFTGDYLKLSRGWPLVARGAYVELLAAQWDAGSLPIDIDELRNITRATPEEWAVAWPYMERCFPVDGVVRSNYVLEILRGEARLLREGRRRGAAKTNAKRWSPKVV